MGDLFSWLLHQGIVRVLSVPIVMLVALYGVYVLASPPPWNDDEDGEPRASA
jgi:hypothetical protein